MTDIVQELNAKETEYAEKLDAIRKTRELFMGRDATATDKHGSLVPVMTDQLREMFADGKPRTIKEILDQLKAANYDGPESRVRGAVRRLTETGELKQRGKGYVNPKANKAA